MEGVSSVRPSVCFEVQKITGVSTGDGNQKSYQVQWAPTWISSVHLVGCEHLIEEFICRQSEEKGQAMDGDITADRIPICDSQNDTVENVLCDAEVLASTQQLSDQACMQVSNDDLPQCSNDNNDNGNLTDSSMDKGVLDSGCQITDMCEDCQTNTDEDCQTKPDEGIQTNLEGIQTNPDEGIQTNLDEGIQTNPDEDSQTNPGEDSQTNPDEDSQTNPDDKLMERSIECINIDDGRVHVNNNVGVNTVANSKGDNDRFIFNSQDLKPFHLDANNLESGRKFQNVSELQRSEVLAVQSKVTVQCTLSKDIRTKIKSLKRPRNECNICHNIFKDIRGLAIHYSKIHYNDSRRKLTCDICNLTCGSEARLLVHKHKHKRKRRSTHKCHCCDKACGSGKHKLIERLKVHTNGHPYDCNVCEKSFKRKSVLRRHLLDKHKGLT